MEVYAKVGTGPGSYIRVKSKRSPLGIGDHIYFKMIPIVHGCKWNSGIVREIREADVGLTMYMIERW